MLLLYVLHVPTRSFLRGEARAVGTSIVLYLYFVFGHRIRIRAFVLALVLGTGTALFASPHSLLARPVCIEYCLYLSSSLCLASILIVSIFIFVYWYIVDYSHLEESEMRSPR